MDEAALKRKIIALLKREFPAATVEIGRVSNSEDEINFSLNGDEFGIIVTQFESDT